MLTRQEARTKLKSAVRELSQRAVDNPDLDITGLLDTIETAAGDAPLGFRGDLDMTQSLAVSRAVAAATGGGSRTGDAVDGDREGFNRDAGGECTMDVSDKDTHTYSEPEDDSDVEGEVEQVRGGGGVRKTKEIPQEPQESLPEWKGWSAKGKTQVDSVKILKTLVSAVFNAIVFIVGLCRGGTVKSGAQPQSSKDVQAYLLKASSG